MRKVTIGAIILTLVCTFCVVSPAIARDYVVREVISLGVGESQQREFEVNDVIQIPALQPMEGFVLVATGSSDAPAGDLTITVSASPEKEFGALMDYGIIGFGFSLDAGVLFIYETVTTPYTISEAVSINSSFGFAYVGAFISGTEGTVEKPVPFTMTFSLAAGEAPAAEG